MINPASEAELAEAIRGANGPLRILGGGTRPIGASHAGETLTTAELNGIELYEPGALTLVVKAGTPVADVEAALAAENQRLPFEPMDHRALLGTEGKPTIGGVVAANVSGPRRIQAGACRDSLIGVRFVDGQGTILKNGGRVMKNVTGYDLVKLMAGSYGTLGVISEVAFKVLPGVEATATLVFEAADWTVTSALFAKALGSPFEVTGAARLPAGAVGKHGAVVLRLEGFKGSVEYRAKALSELLSAEVTSPDRIIKGQQENATLWNMVRDVTPLADVPGDLWRISVKPSNLPRAAAIAGPEEVCVDWGGGLIWAVVPTGTGVRQALQDVLGHATLMRGTGTEETFQPEPAPLAAISNGLRTKFDPKGILNPGLMG